MHEATSGMSRSYHRAVSLIFKLTCGRLAPCRAVCHWPNFPGGPCPIAAALELVGERWALLIVREIALGATHFSDIVRGTGAPRDRIAARLKALESAASSPGRHIRALPRATNTGSPNPAKRSIPVLDALLAWGKVHAVVPDDPDRPTPLPTH